MANIKSMHLDASYMFRFLGTFWDLLPNKDRNRFAETWKGYEQVFGDLLVRGFEHDLAVSVNDMSAFMTQRWNKYIFNTTNQSDAAVSFISQEDLGEGVDLSINYMLSIQLATGIYDIDCRGNFPNATTTQEIVSRINTVVGYTLATAIYADTMIQFTTREIGPTAVLKILIPTVNNATNIILGVLTEYDANPYPWRYTLPSTHPIWDIPTLQNRIRDLSVTITLAANVDYMIVPLKYISFKEMPLNIAWWARDTKINEKLPAYNFGWQVDYVDTTRDPNDYLLILQGLWFAYWMGPRPEFIRRSLCLLLGLPVALAAGIISDITGNQITLTETVTEDTVVYTIPDGLIADVQIGTVVEKFTPLTTGVEIFDKVNRPGFITTDLGIDNLGKFLTPAATAEDIQKALTMLEEHTFLPQISVYSFVRPDISVTQLQMFLNAIKPLHKAYHLQMLVVAPEEALIVQEHFSWAYDINITPTLDMNLYVKQTEDTRAAYEAGEDMPLYLDSEDLMFAESVSITVVDFNGPRPDLAWSIYASIV